MLFISFIVILTILIYSTKKVKDHFEKITINDINNIAKYFEIFEHCGK
jgi:hypothetical protein